MRSNVQRNYPQPGTQGVFVDMAGSAEVTRGVHQRLGDALRYSMRIGNTHWEEGGADTDLPGVTPEFFFAPGQIQKRIQDWGPGGLQERLGGALRSFLDTTPRWLTVERGYGAAEVERVYQETLAGKAEPRIGHVLSMWDDVSGDGVLNTDVAPADTGLLVRIMTAFGPNEINFDDTVHTVAEGILFNSQIAWTEDAPWFADGNIVVAPGDTVHFSSHPTSGNGVHNPTFLDAIMKASLAMGASFYGVAPPAGVNLEGPYTLPASW